jgi:hypothetical protein
MRRSRMTSIATIAAAVSFGRRPSMAVILSNQLRVLASPILLESAQQFGFLG